MKRPPTRFIIAIITFAVGVLAASTWFIYRNPAPPVTVCDLISNPDQYTSTTVRVKAVLSGADEMGLYAECETGRSRIHAIIDDASWRQLVDKGAVPKDAGMYPEVLFNVTVKGRFEKYREVECDESGRQLGGPKFPYTIYCYLFFVSDVESVGPTNVTWPK